MNILGTTQSFIVDRETNLGYVLLLNEEEYFLHHNECAGRKLMNGEKVDAFLYADKKNRLAATLQTPTVTCNKMGFGTVAGVNRELGVFVNIGISKDILLSESELPTDWKQWPQIGDKLFVAMRTKNDKLLLKIANKYQIINTERPDITYEENQRIDGYVYRIAGEGINFVTEDYQVIFVYKTNYRHFYRLGEKALITIVKKNDDDYTGTLITSKEFQIQDDKKIILDYLEKNNGVMMITEQSSPELVMRALHMSKAAFKKAIGGLYREKIISIEEERIILNDFNDI